MRALADSGRTVSVVPTVSKHTTLRNLCWCILVGAPMTNPRLTRRAALLSLVSLPAMAPFHAQGAESGVRPFRVSIPGKKIDHIIQRARDTRFPDALEADDWRYGANWQY